MKSKAIWMCVVFAVSCVDPISVEINDIQPKVVIEGLVADRVGMSFVSVGTTATIQGVGSNLLGTNAQVMVEDDQGQLTAFLEVTPGYYLPEDTAFVGFVGRAYTLEVTTSDGNQYRSTTQIMPPAIAIDSMYVSFVELIDADTKVKRGFHNVMLDLSNSGNEVFYFRSYSKGIAHVFSDPGADCGGCEECWDFRLPINNQIFSGSNQGLERDFSIKTAEIAYDFKDEYFVETTIFSLTPQGSEFWASIQDQQQITGTIFDPQIVQVRGNIINIDASGPEALGYFGASALTSRSLIFNRTLTETTIPITLMPGVCVDVWPNAVGSKPPEFN